MKMMYEIYDTRTKGTVCCNLTEREAMLRANTLNDRYAIQLIRSGKAPDGFGGVFKIRKMGNGG